MGMLYMPKSRFPVVCLHTLPLACSLARLLALLGLGCKLGFALLHKFLPLLLLLRLLLLSVASSTTRTSSATSSPLNDVLDASSRSSHVPSCALALQNIRQKLRGSSPDELSKCGNLKLKPAVLSPMLGRQPSKMSTWGYKFLP